MTLHLPIVEVEPAEIDWHGLPTRFTNPGEIEILITMLRQVRPRRMAEFGVNEGRTARLILDNVPGIIEYLGFDVDRDYTPGKAFQRFEIPDEPGRYARDDPRFRLSVTPKGTRDLTSRRLGKLDAVFIDGDHSRETVEHDTRLAYAAVRPGGLIVWHDYHDLGTVDVRDVLHDLAALGHAIRSVEGTWLAYEIGGSWGCVAAKTRPAHFPAGVIDGAPEGQAR